MGDREQTDWQIDGPAYRRMELTTGSSRRRNWTAADKARIVAESFSGDLTVSEVALRHGLHRNQLYNWRRELATAAEAMETGASFVPVRVAPPEDEDTPADVAEARSDAFTLEVELAGATVRVRNTADGALVRTVLAALSAPR